ncbi:hypothetical protein [Stutzerimonas kunmingensis]|uniref:hypothetical protein n=1 Tax=Stutzerimonas kunmingensis TaxID=1211807 RepID=UPI0028AF3497|nr:hypothetical protein [Stutzerimonas kunmingensis]
MKATLTKCLAALLLVPAFAFAADADPVPGERAYIDPLSLWVRTSYPDNVTTVGEAVNYLLEPSGYRFVTQYPAPKDAARIAGQKLPQEARVYRTMPVADALQILVGKHGYVIVDHNNQLLSLTEEK